MESTMVALCPTRLRGIRLKLQDTFVSTQAASVVMPVGNDFSFHDTDVVAVNDRFVPDSEGELEHTNRSPPLEVQVEIRQRTTEQGSPPSSI